MRKAVIFSLLISLLFSCAQKNMNRQISHKSNDIYDQIFSQQFKENGSKVFCDQTSYTDCFRIDRGQCLQELNPLTNECYEYGFEKVSHNIKDNQEKFGQMFSLCMTLKHLLIHGDENVDIVGECLSNVTFDQEQGKTSLPFSETDTQTFTIHRDPISIKELREDKLKKPIQIGMVYPQNGSNRKLAKEKINTKLRSVPSTLSIEEVKQIIKKHNFYDSDFNPNGNFENDYIDNGDGTITDQSTNLMWTRFSLPPKFEKIRFSNYIKIDPEKYTKKMNEINYCGHSNWRLPTFEELASLLSKNDLNGVHGDAIFWWDLYENWGFLTADKRKGDNRYWKVHFGMGTVIPNYGYGVSKRQIRIWRYRFTPIRLVRDL